MSVPTNAELLEGAKSALLRLLNGAKSVQVNGNQFCYTSVPEPRSLIAELEVKVAEDAGTDGRGAWDASFRDNARRPHRFRHSDRIPRLGRPALVRRPFPGDRAVHALAPRWPVYGIAWAQVEVLAGKRVEKY